MIYRAFVSSTYEDLKEHRAHVINALRKAGFTVDPMEDWTAAIDEPKQFSQDRVKNCDLCVLIVGFRRGHIPPGHNSSITQLEYEAAKKLNIDVLVFILNELAPWPRNFDELDKDPEIRLWRNELMEHTGVGFFEYNPTSIEIAPALTRWITSYKQSAVNKANDSSIDPLDAKKAVVPLPVIPTAPHLDPTGPYVKCFVGREITLGAFADALHGLCARALGDIANSRAGNVRLLWIYGFGGMGKSWFLRNVAAQTLNTKVAVVLLDWDDLEWRSPLSNQPSIPIHLFEALSTRLAQVYGTENLREYWEAIHDVSLATEQHTALYLDFKMALETIVKYGDRWCESAEAMQFQASGDTKALKSIFVLDELLRSESLIRGSGADMRGSQLSEFRSDQFRFRSLFETWVIQLLGHKTTAQVSQPERHLVDALRRSIVQLSAEKPLLLIIDTCEILSADLDAWLRILMAPLLSGDNLVLMLIGSRLRPDVEMPSGARNGWREMVPQMRVEEFNENVALTVSEIDQLLRRVFPDQAVPKDIAESLHRMTLGVPLALKVVLEMMENDQTLLYALDMPDENASVGSADEVTQRVIETVSGRFLLHLENRPEKSEDFDDIVAIGILLTPSLDILRHYWGSDHAATRLHRLANRYSILAGGDLHYAIRRYIRKAWRSRPPPNLCNIAQRLLDVVTAALLDNEEEQERLLLEQINLQSWSSPSPPWKDFARVAIYFLSHEFSPWNFRDLLLEIPVVTESDRVKKRNLLNLLDSSRSSLGKASAVQELMRIAGDALSNVERGLAAMLLGIEAAADRPQDAIKHFFVMRDLIGTSMPQPVSVAEKFLGACLIAGDNKSLSQAYEWYSQFGDTVSVRPFFLSTCLRELGKFEEAEHAFLSGIDADPTDDGLPHQLAHLYEQQNRMDEAERHFEMAAELGQYEDTNWTCLAKFHEQRGNLVRALEVLRRGAHFIPSSISVQIQLWRHLSATGASKSEIQEAYKAVNNEISSSEDPSDLNSFAWQLIEANQHIGRAIELARKAHKISNWDLNILHTLVSALLVQQNWREARPFVEQIIERVDPENPSLSRNSLNQFMSDALAVGGKQFFDMLESDQWWRYRVAIQALGQFPSIELNEYSLNHADHEDIKNLITDLKLAGFLNRSQVPS